MLINYEYPTTITWKMDFSNIKSGFDPFGVKTRKKLKSAMNKFELSNYSIILEEVDDSYIDKFNPIYKSNIETKSNPKTADLKDRIIINPPHNFPYYAFSLYCKDKYEGGIIFSNREDHLVIGYKVFPKSLDIKLPINVSFVAEYYLNEYAINNNMKYIRRGSDRNPYGLNSAIGLAMFKIQAGYWPYMKDEYKDDEIKARLNYDGKDDILLFKDSIIGGKITQGVLFSESNLDQIEEKYRILLKNGRVNMEFIKYT